MNDKKYTVKEIIDDLILPNIEEVYDTGNNYAHEIDMVGLYDQLGLEWKGDMTEIQKISLKDLKKDKDEPVRST